MIRPFLLSCQLALLLSVQVFSQPSEFSQDSAFAFLRVVAQDIGPRTMGSPAEQRAMEFAVSKFRAFGCQQSYIMPMSVAEGVNTTSGIAVGVLRGKTGRMMIIGGHIDSSDPEVPGANDNGSGVACVIEIARVMAMREHESTMLFCCWGGEEEGLQGSKYFVDHFQQLDSVGLMVQIDMADGVGLLEVDPDAGYVSAPRWLTKATYDVFYGELGYSGLDYPVFSVALNGLMGGFAGSDHGSFLKKGIPAIDFTSDISYPIHTQLDNLANFTPSGLKRTGDLVLKLVDRFDRGTPSRTTERYMLIQLGNTPVFIPYWMLWGFIVGAAIVSVVAFVLLHRRTRLLDEQPRVHWSALKLLPFAFVIQAAIWLSENAVGSIRGYRFPWVNNFPWFVVFGLLLGAVALWVLLQITKRVRFTKRVLVYARIPFLMFLAGTVVFAFSSPEVAVYPAAILLFFSAALLVRSPMVKTLFFAAAVGLAVRLVFPEWLGLLQRNLAERTWSSAGREVIYNLVFIILYSVVFLPFVYGFVAVYMDSKVDLLWLKRFRGKTGLAIVSLSAVLLFLLILTRPVYSPLWASVVRVEERCGSGSIDIWLKGSEFLKGLAVTFNGKDTVFSDRTRLWLGHPPGPVRVDWCGITRESVPSGAGSTGDSTLVLERRLLLHSKIRPLSVKVTYNSNDPFEVTSSWAHGGRRRSMEKESERTKTFLWYSFPDTVLDVPITFVMHEGQSVSETIEVAYDTLVYPMELKREHTNVVKRTFIFALDTLHGSGVSGTPERRTY